jgi:hypothetical protein
MTWVSDRIIYVDAQITEPAGRMDRPCAGQVPRRRLRREDMATLKTNAYSSANECVLKGIGMGSCARSARTAPSSLDLGHVLR